MSLSMIPPCIVALVGRWCFLAMLTPSTMTRFFSGMTRMITPSLPTSFPAMTLTRSPLRSFTSHLRSENRAQQDIGRRRRLRRAWSWRRPRSQNLRRQRDDSHELPIPEFAPDRSEDTGASWLHLVVDQHGGVLVEPDVAAVRAPLLLGRPHDDAFDDVTLLHRRPGNGVLDGGHEDVADAGVAPLRAAQ